MIFPDRTQRSCSAPSANRYPYCGCDACTHAYKLLKRTRRRVKSEGDIVCACGHRFTSEHGYRIHLARVHGSQAVAS